MRSTTFTLREALVRLVVDPSGLVCGTLDDLSVTPGETTRDAVDLVLVDEGLAFVVSAPGPLELEPRHLVASIADHDRIHGDPDPEVVRLRADVLGRRALDLAEGHVARVVDIVVTQSGGATVVVAVLLRGPRLLTPATRRDWAHVIPLDGLLSGRATGAWRARWADVPAARRVALLAALRPDERQRAAAILGPHA